VSCRLCVRVDMHVLCVCVHAYTHTARGELGCEPRCWDGTPWRARKNVYKLYGTDGHTFAGLHVE